VVILPLRGLLVIDKNLKTSRELTGRNLKTVKKLKTGGKLKQVESLNR